MAGFDVVSIPTDRLDDLQPVWRALYEHHIALTPHLHDRARSFEHAWEARQRIEAERLAQSPTLSSWPLGRAIARRLRLRPGLLRRRFRGVLERLGPIGRTRDPRRATRRTREGDRVGSLDAVEQRLRALGIDDMLIGVITTNTDAMRLYDDAAPSRPTHFVQRVSPSDPA